MSRRDRKKAARGRRAGPASENSRKSCPAASEAPITRPGFVVAMWLLPVLFFLLLEGGLRLFGYGDDYPLFIPTPEYPEYRYQNPEVARRYFTKQVRVPTGLNDVFRADKDSLVYRIFVQGGSSAAGYPYYYGGAFSRMLEQRLQQTFPDLDVELVNTSLAAVNSYTLLDFTSEIIAQRPDAVLIYAGHNEFYGALGVGSTESLGLFPTVIRLYLRLQRLRTVQAVRGILGAVAGVFAPDHKDAPGNTLMERMVGEQSIPYGSDTYRMGIDQFRGNLRRILEKYADHGIPVYIGTLASNERDHSPFISATLEPINQSAYDSLLELGRQARDRNDLAAALRSYDEAISLDSSAAMAYFERARAQEVMGNFTASAEDYGKARDRDQLRFRASEELNRVIREEASAAGARIVETNQALRDASPGGIIDNTLMLEHLHPNVDGYFLISDAFYRALRSDARIGDWQHAVSTRDARDEILVTAVDSLFGAFRLRQLIGSWPFQPPGTIDRSLDTLRAASVEETIALDLVRSEINWYEATDRLRRHYVSTGDPHRALRASLAMIQQFPFLAAPYAYAGEILARQARLEEARIYLEAANDRQESVSVLSALGNLNVLMGLAEEAVRVFERVRTLDPNNEDATFRLAVVYAGLGRRTDAIELLDHLLRLNPSHSQAARFKHNLDNPGGS